MINHTLRRISTALENLACQNISLERALDLLEASTQNLEEIVVINTMRESMQEADHTMCIIEKEHQRTQNNITPYPLIIPTHSLADIAYYA